eukprot:30850-Pelagococcus_subviridis.AAC.32
MRSWKHTRRTSIPDSVCSAVATARKLGHTRRRPLREIVRERDARARDRALSLHDARVDRVLENEHPFRQPPARKSRRARVRRRRGMGALRQQRRPGGGERLRIAREPPDGVERGREGYHAVCAHAPVRRPEPEHAHARRGDAHAPAAVRPERERRLAADGHRGAGGRAARDPSARVRVHGSAVVRVLAVDGIRELVHVRRADAAGAGVAQQRDRARGGG